MRLFCRSLVLLNLGRQVVLDVTQLADLVADHDGQVLGQVDLSVKGAEKQMSR